MQNAAPFAVPAGTTNYPVLGEPLPDIFGAETSFITNRPLSPTPVQRSYDAAPVPAALRATPPASPVNPAPQSVTAAPVSSSPAGNAAVDSSTTIRESPEVLTDDETASVASETSPDGKSKQQCFYSFTE